jgi:hypothetical protein
MSPPRRSKDKTAADTDLPTAVEPSVSIQPTDVSDTAPTRSVKIPYAYYPEIVEAVARFVTDTDTLLAVRATCRKFRLIVDKEHFAPNILLKFNERPRCRDINIRFFERKELSTHAKTADIVGPCSCGSGSTYPCLAAPQVLDLPTSLDLAYTRVFVDTFAIGTLAWLCYILRSSEEHHFSTRASVWVLNVARTEYNITPLPLALLPGSTRGRIILRFDPASPHLRHVAFYNFRFTIPPGGEYEIFFLPTLFSAPSCDRPRSFFAEHRDAPNRRLDSLLQVLCGASKDRSASFLLVGYERLPASCIEAEWVTSGASSSSETDDGPLTGDMLQEWLSQRPVGPEEAESPKIQWQTASEYAEEHGYDTLGEMDIFHGL